MAAVIQYYSRCTYPTDKMNVSCLLKSCPGLNGVCPLTSNGNVNQTALSSAVFILNTCIGQEGLACGINMTHTPLVVVAWSLAQLVPPGVANGTVSIVPGTGFIDNFSQLKFSLPPQRANSNGSIRAPNIVHSGQCSCNFSIAPTSVANVFKVLFSTPQGHFTIPNMAGMISVNLSSATVSIDLSTSPTIETLEYEADLNCEYTNFISEGGVEVPSYVVQPFKESVIYATTTTYGVGGQEVGSSGSSSSSWQLSCAARKPRALGPQLNCPMHQE